MWILIIVTLSSGPLLLVSGLLPTRAIEVCDVKGSNNLDKDMQRFLADRKRVMEEVVRSSETLVANTNWIINDLKKVKLVTASDRRDYEEMLDSVIEVVNSQADIQATKIDDLLDSSLIWVQMTPGCWHLTDGK